MNLMPRAFSSLVSVPFTLQFQHHKACGVYFPWNGEELLQQVDIEQVNEYICVVNNNLLHQMTFKCLRTVVTELCRRLAALDVLIKSLAAAAYTIVSNFLEEAS